MMQALFLCLTEAGAFVYSTIHPSFLTAGCQISLELPRALECCMCSPTSRIQIMHTTIANSNSLFRAYISCSGTTTVLVISVVLSIALRGDKTMRSTTPREKAVLWKETVTIDWAASGPWKKAWYSLEEYTKNIGANDVFQSTVMQISNI